LICLYESNFTIIELMYYATKKAKDFCLETDFAYNNADGLKSLFIENASHFSKWGPTSRLTALLCYLHRKSGQDRVNAIWALKQVLFS